MPSSYRTQIVKYLRSQGFTVKVWTNIIQFNNYTITLQESEERIQVVNPYIKGIIANFPYCYPSNLLLKIRGVFLNNSRSSNQSYTKLVSENEGLAVVKEHSQKIFINHKINY